MRKFLLPASIRLPIIAHGFDFPTLFFGHWVEASGYAGWAVRCRRCQKNQAVSRKQRLLNATAAASIGKFWLKDYCLGSEQSEA